MGDISNTKHEWLQKILDVVENTPRHRYYFLTKNPKKLWDVIFPKNAWVGVTINRQADLYRSSDLQLINARIKFISFEPVYERIGGLFYSIPELLRIGYNEEPQIDWIIIGAQTNPNFQPKKEWIDELIAEARQLGIPIFMKDNLKYPISITEFPEEFQ